MKQLKDPIVYGNPEAFVGKLRNHRGLILECEEVKRNMRAVVMRAVVIDKAYLIVEWQVFLNT